MRKKRDRSAADALYSWDVVAAIALNALEIRDLGLTLEEYLEQYYEPID